MGGAKELSSSLNIEIAIIQAKNMEFKSHGTLFVRCYLSDGTHKRVQLNSKEISSKSNLSWNESFSLECSSTGDSINTLKKESLILELRWRNANPALGLIGRSSKLLGKAEIPWRTVVESPNMEMEKWVTMVPTKKSCSSVLDDSIMIKPPSVQIGMRIRVPDLMMEKKNKNRNGGLRKREYDECGCCNLNGCSCQDYEIFALVGAFEAL